MAALTGFRTSDETTGAGRGVRPFDHGAADGGRRSRAAAAADGRLASAAGARLAEGPEPAPDGVPVQEPVRAVADPGADPHARGLRPELESALSGALPPARLLRRLAVVERQGRRRGRERALPGHRGDARRVGAEHERW